MFVAGEAGNLAFRPAAGEMTSPEDLWAYLQPDQVRVISPGASEPLSISALQQAIGRLDEPQLLYTADVGSGVVRLRENVSLEADSAVAFILDGAIVASGTGGIRLQGPVTVAADSRLTTTGAIILGNMATSGRSATVELASGAGGIQLLGSVNLGVGDLVLASQGAVNVAGAIKARGLALLGENVDYQLLHPDNAVAVLAGNAGSIRYQQAGSLTIGQVGATAGLHGSDSVLVVLSGAGSGLTVAQGVSAQGTGYAIVLATAGRFINQAGASPFTTAANGYYLVFSADHAQRQLGEMASPGNLFGWTYDDTAVDRLGMSCFARPWLRSSGWKWSAG